MTLGHVFSGHRSASHPPHRAVKYRSEGEQVSPADRFPPTTAQILHAALSVGNLPGMIFISRLLRRP